MTKEEAEKKALEARPNNEIVETFELKDCFVVNTLPKNYSFEENGLYVGGGIRVDKKTGKIGLYNPIRDGMIEKG